MLSSDLHFLIFIEPWCQRLPPIGVTPPKLAAEIFPSGPTTVAASKPRAPQLFSAASHFQLPTSPSIAQSTFGKFQISFQAHTRTTSSPLCPDDNTINRKLESLILREMQLDMYVSLNDNVSTQSRRTSSISRGRSG